MSDGQLDLVHIGSVHVIPESEGTLRTRAVEVGTVQDGLRTRLRVGGFHVKVSTWKRVIVRLNKTQLELIAIAE